MTGDWIKSALPTVNSALCIWTALLALLTGSIQNLNGIDWVCFLIGAAAGACWWIFKSASMAQVLLQTALVIGFVPTIAGVWHSPTIEPWLPWLLWTTSFVTQMFVVKFTWRGKLVDFLYPVNMAFFHGAVFVLALG